MKGRVSSYIILYGLIQVRSWRGATVSLMTRLRKIWELWLWCISKYLSSKELMFPIVFRFLSSKWNISFFPFSLFFNHHFVVHSRAFNPFVISLNACLLDLTCLAFLWGATTTFLLSPEVIIFDHSCFKVSH